MSSSRLMTSSGRSTRVMWAGWRIGCYGWDMNLSYFKKRSVKPVERPNDCLDTAKLLLLHPDLPNGGHSAHRHNLIAALLARAGDPAAHNHAGIDDPEKKRGRSVQ